jgi:hypothetical protein
MIFLIAQKNLAKILAFLTQITSYLLRQKNMIFTLLLRKTPIFSAKVVKKRKNNDHNIDP